jgi:hypothetical protein
VAESITMVRESVLTPPARARVARAGERLVVDGKFFRVGRRKYFVRGCTYGPFAPNFDSQPFPEPARVEADFELLKELGANTIRVYHLPPSWFLDAAAEAELKIFLDIPWRKHTCFLDDPVASR